MSDSGFPFTHEMVVVHKLFRREFTQAPGWVRRVAPGDTKQAQLVYTHMKKDFDLLHHHHEAEDINLWPRLRERATDQEELLDTMEGQHRAIDPALAKAEELGAAWAETADVEARDAFADAIEEFSAPLLAHLDQEEADILPLAQEYVTEEEWGLLAKHALASHAQGGLDQGPGRHPRGRDAGGAGHDARRHPGGAQAPLQGIRQARVHQGRHHRQGGRSRRVVRLAH